MTLRTIVCADCGEIVPYGRLSCPACGAVLASVTGGSRAPGSTADLAPAPSQHPGSSTGDEAPLAMSPSRVERSEPRADHGTIGSYEPPGSPVPSILTPSETPPVAPMSTGPGDPAGAASLVPADQVIGRTAGARSTAGTPSSSIAGLDIGIDRAIAVGAGLVAIGLLLPWSRVVIGSPNLDSYIGTWGLAGPGHIIVLVAAVAVAALAGVPNRLPAWIRSGVAGLSLGAFVIGLLWPYVVGPLGSAVGSLLSLAGAMVLAIAGVAALWRARHEPFAPDV